MKKILIAEDEENILDTLVLNFELEGYDVQGVNNGKDAISAFQLSEFNLVILDVMMPHVNGFDVCEIIRKTNPLVPVMFLTAKNDSDDRVKGLKIGADDYLAKPFNLEELLLRAKNLLNRFTPVQTQEIEECSFGVFKVDFKTFDVLKNGEKFKQLAKKEILLIQLLFKHKDEVVSRGQILDEIWGTDANPSSRTIDNYILTLRKYFEENPRQPLYFHSIRGVGYKFTPRA